MARTARTSPLPKQTRAVGTIDLVIAEARKAIQSGGESAIKIQEISAHSGVSIGSIYHHFGDRDGLIRATYVEIFSASVQEDIDRLKEFVGEMTSTKELAKHYHVLLGSLSKHFDKLPAQERAAIIGNVTGRPELRSALADVQTQLIDNLTEVMKLLKDRGILKEFLDPRAVATVVLGLMHGRVIAELDNKQSAQIDWDRAALAAFSGFVVASQ